MEAGYRRRRLSDVVASEKLEVASSMIKRSTSSGNLESFGAVKLLDKDEESIVRDYVHGLSASIKIESELDPSARTWWTCRASWAVLYF